MVIGRWVLAGAWAATLTGPAYGEKEIDWDKARDFWAFKAPVKAPLPKVQNEAWVRTDLDRFILRRLEQQGLSPLPEADPAVLARRVSLDVTGLPPAQAPVEDKVEEAAPESYRDMVARLLSSPAYGERLASMWMNVARYSEDQPAGRRTHFGSAYHYRSWVIDAFNRDLSYDQFVRNQLAADLYEGDQKELAALGFLALGPYAKRGSSIFERIDIWADRVDLVSRSFLGLTVACARCHDHLYDPVSTEDYYSFAGIFASMDDDEVDVEGKYFHTVREGIVRTLRVFRDGDPNKAGELVPRRNIRLLSRSPERPIYEGSGRRELAEEITSADNPLVARVMVNRIWAEMMGRPLVATLSNFGNEGARPTHPELLDFLAVKFVENGWSLKWLVREIVSSATYRQESVAAGDSRLEHYVGMPRRRLTAEMIRDAMLVVSAELTNGGTGSDSLDDSDNTRRTIYGVVQLTSLNGFLREFDYPDPAEHAPVRGTTTTPRQKLFLLNSKFVHDRAEGLARKVFGREAEPALNELYLRVFGRWPREAEQKLALGFLGGEAIPPKTRWVKLAQVLLCSHSFLYRE